MATISTFSPSGFLEFATATVATNCTTFLNQPISFFASMPTARALPEGSDPATVLIQNMGPEQAAVLIETAAATTTATQATVGASSITVADATDIELAQIVVAAGIPDGTVVTSITGTTIGISQGTTAALSSAAVNFITPPALDSSIVSQPGVPLSLNYVASGFISALCLNSGSRAIVNVAVGV